MVTVVERGPRADKGRIRCSPRDERGLSFLATMRAVWEPDFKVLLREPGGPPLSERAVQACVDRWRRAGWVRAEKTWTKRPRMVTLTPAGAGMVAEAPTYKPLSEQLLLHHAAVSRCRLWLSQVSLRGWGRLVGWTSEREWRRDHYDPRTGADGEHPVDGLADFEQMAGVAIEVELTPKEAKRLEPIVEALALGYQAALYFAVPAARSAVAGAVDRLVDQARIPPQRVLVMEMPTDPTIIR